MKYRPFGRTGFDVSEIVFGGGYTGGVLFLTDDATGLAALEGAVRAGINLIDTSAYYGAGKSEEAIGRLLPQISSQPRVATKFLLKPDDLSDVAGAIERSLEQSLKRLRTDRLFLLQLHNPMGASGPLLPMSVDEVLGRGGVADGLERLKRSGVISAMGITGLGDVGSVIRVIESGRFDSAQVYYNAINPSAAWEVPRAGFSPESFAGILPACRRQGMGVLCIRPLAGGALASQVRHGREFVLTKGTDQAEEERRAALLRREFGDSYGTPAETALRFVLSHDGISGVVTGIGAPEHVGPAVAASARGALPVEALSRIDALCSTDFRTGPNG